MCLFIIIAKEDPVRQACLFLLVFGWVSSLDKYPINSSVPLSSLAMRDWLATHKHKGSLTCSHLCLPHGPAASILLAFANDIDISYLLLTGHTWLCLGIYFAALCSTSQKNTTAVLFYHLKERKKERKVVIYFSFYPQFWNIRRN